MARTKQPKRKAKVGIIVQDLHKLQDQPGPSNFFLFYQYMGEEILHATAAKLMECIAMKTITINKSVNKWADWTRSKVRSIIEWIKTGGKNNKVVLEKLEKRCRDQFRNESHTKKHERKGKEGTVEYRPQQHKHL